MRFDGKVYRYISIAFFILHCIHFLLMMTGVFLPYVNGESFINIFSHIGVVIVIGLLSLAAGCWFSWRTIQHPKCCIATLLLDAVWHGIHFILFFSLAPTAILVILLGMEVSMQFGDGVLILLRGLLIIQADFVFLVYYLIMAIIKRREKME